MLPSPPSSCAVVVIGAGQAGLGAAYHLRKRGLVPGRDLVILDAEEGPGGAWRHRWPSLTLGGTHHLHDLPGMSEAGVTFADAPEDRPAREVVAERFDAYERHLGLQVVRPVRVDTVTREEDRYVVSGAARGRTGSIRCRVVVNATGTWTRPRTPAIPGRSSFTGLQITTAQYHVASEFAGLRVAVVGGGTSALTFLDEIGDVARELHWFTRRPPSFHDEATELSPERGRIAVAIQDEAARAGRPLPSIVSVTGLPTSPLVRRLREAGRLERLPIFAEIDATGVVTREDRHIDLDAIVWATGFRPALDHLAPLGIVSPAGGPVVEDGRVAGEPGLFLAGYGPQASTLSANRAARSIARQVSAILAQA